MTEAVKEKLFEPYFTTKGVGQGTGLGLAVVHGIVQEHGGNIVVTSSPGQGATFDLYFPVLTVANMVDEAEVGNDHLGFRSATGKTLLFVEDEPSIRALAHLILLPMGYRVDLAENGEQALQMFLKDPSRYDAIVSDLTMPKLTGLKLAEAVRRENSDIPFILISGYGEMVRPEDLNRQKINRLLPKPLARADLLKTLELALSNEDPAE